MVPYNLILCDLCGDKVYGEFFGEPNSSPHEVRRAEQPQVSVAASSSAGVLNEATHDSVLLAALEQFEDQATDMLQLLSVSEECEDSGTTQKKDVKKTPAKMLPSTLRKH